MVLGPFPERKGPRLPGRNPATPKTTLMRYLVKRGRRVYWKPQDRFLIHIVKLLSRNHQCRMIRYLSTRVPLNGGGRAL